MINLSLFLINEIIIYIIILIALVIASYTDFKKREVPDWLNYGLIFTGLGLNLMFSVILWEYKFIVNSLVGFGIFLAFAYIMFYAGQWGGGDSKMLMGLGALIGLDISFKEMPFLITFFINMLVIGALYGFAWSFFLAIKHWKKFSKKYKQIIGNKTVFLSRRYLLIFILIIFILNLFVKNKEVSLTTLSSAFVIFVTFYIWIFIKAVEKSSMFKYVKPMELTEGDWIGKDVKVDGKYICGPKDLGIERKQINKLINLYKKNKIKKILIKEGIPFVPSFLIAFVVSLLFGNLVFLVL